MTRIRAFVAVRLPPTSAEEYATAQAALSSLRGVKWVERANLHLTLKFLGAIESASLPAVGEALARAAAASPPGMLTPERITAFPDPRKARVMVVELADRDDVVHALAARVERELAALGHPPEERGFRTHVTLGRVRVGAADARALLAAAPLPAHGWSVEQFDLIESRLGPRGPTYVPLRSFALRGVRSGPG